jgi:hypothetical protein
VSPSTRSILDGAELHVAHDELTMTIDGKPVLATGVVFDRR